MSVLFGFQLQKRSSASLPRNIPRNLQYTLAQSGARQQDSEDHNDILIKEEDNEIKLEDVDSSSALTTIEDTGQCECDEGDVKQEELEAEGEEEEEQQCDILTNQRECSDGGDAHTPHAAGDEQPEEVYLWGGIDTDTLNGHEVNVNEQSVVCQRRLRVEVTRLPDKLLRLYIKHAVVNIAPGAQSVPEVAICNDESSDVKTEQLEQITQEDEQNDNAANKNECKDDVGEDIDEQHAATDEQANADSTYAYLKLKRTAAAHTHAGVEHTVAHMDSASSFKSANNYTPKTQKTGATCGINQTNNSYIASKCPDSVKKADDTLLHSNFNICSANIKQKTNQNSETSLKNKYTCTLCEYTSDKESAFKYHLKVHSATTQYICDTCSYITTGKNALIRHIRVHTGVFPIVRKMRTNKSLVKQTSEISFACKFCNKKFSFSSSLKRHIRIHTGERPYTCKICENKYTGSSSLRYHILTHTSEKSFACKFCNKKFSFSSSLKRHIRRHTGEKPYTCKICENKYIDSSSLRYHILAHTGEKRFACQHCDKKFTQSSTLSMHIRTHTGEKSFACQFCDKKFVNNGHLTVHIRTHTGDKPFVCKICNKKFAQSSTLKTHVTRHTNEKRFN